MYCGRYSLRYSSRRYQPAPRPTQLTGTQNYVHWRGKSPASSDKTHFRWSSWSFGRNCDSSRCRHFIYQQQCKWSAQTRGWGYAKAAGHKLGFGNSSKCQWCFNYHVCWTTLRPDLWRWFQSNTRSKSGRPLWYVNQNLSGLLHGQDEFCASHRLWHWVRSWCCRYRHGCRWRQ